MACGEDEDGDQGAARRNLMEVCVGFIGNVGSGGDGGGGLLGGGLLGGLFGGANPSQTQLNESVIEGNNRLAELPGKGQLSNKQPDTGNGSVGTNYGGLTLQGDRGGSGHITVEPSDANIDEGQHIDGLEYNGTHITLDLTQNVQGINKEFQVGSPADKIERLTSQLMRNAGDNDTELIDSLLEHVLSDNGDALATRPTEKLSNIDHDTVSGFDQDISENNSRQVKGRLTNVSISSSEGLPNGLPVEFHGKSSDIWGIGRHEKPLENTDNGLVSGQSEEYHRNYSTLVVSIEVTPCSKGKYLIKGYIRGFHGNKTTNTSGGQRVNFLGNNTARLISKFDRKLDNVSGRCNYAHLGVSSENVTGGGGNGSNSGLLGGLLPSGGGMLGGLLGGGGGGSSNAGSGNSGGGGGLVGGLLGGGGNGGLVGGLLGKKREEPQQNLKDGS